MGRWTRRWWVERRTRRWGTEGRRRIWRARRWWVERRTRRWGTEGRRIIWRARRKAGSRKAWRTRAGRPAWQPWGLVKATAEQQQPRASPSPSLLVLSTAAAHDVAADVPAARRAQPTWAAQTAAQTEAMPRAGAQPTPAEVQSQVQVQVDVDMEGVGEAGADVEAEAAHWASPQLAAKRGRPPPILPPWPGPPSPPPPSLS